jgi:hypothetical protein
LRLIKWACETDYPTYSAATVHALDYLDKEWKDTAQEAREARRGSEIPGAAARMAAEERRASTSQKPEASIQSRAKTKRPGLFGMLKRKSWKKGSKSDITLLSPEEPGQERSMSYAAPSDLITPPLSPERSKSVSVDWQAASEVPVKSEAPPSSETPTAVPVEAEKPTTDNELLSRVETALSLSDQKNLEPIASMISRHDQWRSPY